MESVAGIYIHAPFCKSKCLYCDFNSYAGLEQTIGAYIEAVCAEISQWGDYLEQIPPNDRIECFSSLYFGGGTPSILPVESIERLISGCRQNLGLTANAEVSLEANPGTVNEQSLFRLRSAGVNRLSLGVQSMANKELGLLGRIHSAAEATGAVNAARYGGFDNLSIDLMFGLPYQTLPEWAETLNRAIDLSTEHISLYALTIEETTPLASMIEKGTLPLPDSDLAADMYEHARDVLHKASYHQYEISNWAKPGFECQHNLVYWRNQPYLGLGAGAHSSLFRKRFNNVCNPEAYIDGVYRQPMQSPQLAAGERSNRAKFPVHGAIEGVEDISGELAMAETMFLGLRLLDGVDPASFAERFGERPEDIYGFVLEDLQQLDLVGVSDRAIALTPRALLLANEVFVRFLPTDR